MESVTGTIWDYFSKVERDSKKFSKCRLCFFELSGQLAGNASKHLQKRHDLMLPKSGGQMCSSDGLKEGIGRLEQAVGTPLNDAELQVIPCGGEFLEEHPNS